MKLIERAGWLLIIIALSVALSFHKSPVVVAAAAAPVIQVAPGQDKPCLAITHRYNAKTGKLEPVAANDPLGIR